MPTWPSTQLRGLETRFAVTIERRPIPVLALMKQVGNRPTTVECRAKGRYAMRDLLRWSQHLGVPLKPNSHTATIDTERLLLGALAAQACDQGDAYVDAVFRGVWAEACAFDSDATLVAVLERSGIARAQAIVAAGPTYHPVLRERLAQADADGCFGVPSFVVDGQLFFGNDRLTFVEALLAA
jgi:2-hydroxychromene-2-carboxylate isomerase